MTKSKGKSNYRAYLLRCWRETNQWRYSLEQVGNGRRHGFASVKMLMAYLREVERLSPPVLLNDQEVTDED